MQTQRHVFHDNMRPDPAASFLLQTNTNYSLAVELPTSPVYVIERNS